MTFGENLRSLRKKYKITQEDLGKELGITQQGVAKYEKMVYAPKGATINNIANALSKLTNHEISYLALLPGGIRNEDDLKTALDEIDKSLYNVDTYAGLANDAFIRGDYKEERKYIDLMKEATDNLESALSAQRQYEEENGITFSSPLEYEIYRLKNDNKYRPQQNIDGCAAKIYIDLEKLNFDGQQAAVERVEELTEIQKYKKQLFSWDKLSD